MSRKPGCGLPRVNPNPNAIDLKQLQMQELSRQDDAQYRGFGGSDDVTFASASLSNTKKGPATVTVDNYGFETIDLYFDSLHRNRTTNLLLGEITWNITQLNNAQGLPNIVSIDLEPFYFPNIVRGANEPSFFYARRVFIQILGLASTQTTRGPNGQQFHFECRVDNVTNDGQAVLLTPLRPRFIFSQPVTEMTALQLRFSVPKTEIGAITPLSIPIPVENIVIRSLTTGGFGYNPIRFTVIGATTSILGNIGALTAPGVAVFISGYASNSATTNSAVNNQIGVFVTNIIDASTFEIAGIDATTVTANYDAIMYIPKNRIAFCMHFGTIVTKITNHVDIVQ